jgi:ABC-2 type transport system ATP-binding protein
VLGIRGAMNRDPAVETDGLKKRYGDLTALAGVSLSIEAGEIFALLGPNGAGKTTWISIVCGLVRATAGRARVMGHDVARDPIAARKLVGLVPQEVNFDPFFTPREVLSFQMGYYGQRPDRARVDEVLRALDLHAKADTNTRALSGGMKRRLLIGKALVHRPRVVFLDEPTAGVDVALRRDLWSYVRRLRQEGTTIVLTTHYLEEAEALADRVAVIDHGQLVGLDTTRALLARFGNKQIRVRLTAPVAGAAATASSLPSLPAWLQEMGATVDATGCIVTCPLGGMAPAALLARLGALQPAVADIDTEQPSLEQVFLALTGDNQASATKAPS